MELSSSNYKKQDRYYLCCLVVLTLFQIWKATRGMGSADEHFYTTLAYRFMRGDALFFDDWHIAQMIAFFLEPLVRLYVSVTGSMDGIQFYMRCCYILFTVITAMVFYYRFRSYGYSTILASAIYLLYTPLQIMALSYNTMSAGFVILALCVYPVEKEQKWRLLFTGIFASFAVINTPYLALIYVGLTLLTILRPTWFSHRRWLSLSGGVVIAAILFLTYVGLHTPWREVLAGLPHLIDPSHSKGLYMFARNIALLWRYFHFFAVLLILELVVGVIARKRIQSRCDTVLTLSCLISLLSILYVMFISTYQRDLGSRGTVLFPFMITGCMFILCEKEHSYLDVCFGIALFHSFMILLSSNVGPRSYCGPLILACMVTVLVMRAFWKNTIMVRIVCVCLLGALAISKGVDVFEGSGTYDTKIMEGPLAGLYDERSCVERYERGLKDIQTINEREEEHAMLITWEVWEYLALDKTIATFSTYPYFWEEEEYVHAQYEYQLEHTDRFPTLIYLDRENAPYRMKLDDPFFQDTEPLLNLQEGTLLYGK